MDVCVQGVKGAPHTSVPPSFVCDLLVCICVHGMEVVWAQTNPRSSQPTVRNATTPDRTNPKGSGSGPPGRAVRALTRPRTCAPEAG